MRTSIGWERIRIKMVVTEFSIRSSARTLVGDTHGVHIGREITTFRRYPFAALFFMVQARGLCMELRLSSQLVTATHSFAPTGWDATFSFTGPNGMAE